MKAFFKSPLFIVPSVLLLSTFGVSYILVFSFDLRMPSILDANVLLDENNSFYFFMVIIGTVSTHIVAAVRSVFFLPPNLSVRVYRPYLEYLATSYKDEDDRLRYIQFVEAFRKKFGDKGIRLGHVYLITQAVYDGKQVEDGDIDQAPSFAPNEKF